MRFLVYCVLLSCAACGQSIPPTPGVSAASTPAAPPPQEPALNVYQLFQMRSECAKLGQKILDSMSFGPHINSSVLTNVDARKGHCYVEIDTDNAQWGAGKPPVYYRRNLYDGHTGETLAWHEHTIKNFPVLGNNYEDSGRVYADDGVSGTAKEAKDYITRLMKVDR